MSTPSEIAGRSFAALLSEAETAGLGREAVARAMLSQVLAHYRRTRAAPDIADELRYEIERLESDDDDIAFMRP